MKKTNWKSVLLYIIRIVELVPPVEPLAVGSDENHHADYRALLCQ